MHVCLHGELHAKLINLRQCGQHWFAKPPLMAHRWRSIGNFPCPITLNKHCWIRPQMRPDMPTAQLPSESQKRNQLTYTHTHIHIHMYVRGVCVRNSDMFVWISNANNSAATTTTTAPSLGAQSHKLRQFWVVILFAHSTGQQKRRHEHNKAQNYDDCLYIYIYFPSLFSPPSDFFYL